MKKTMRIPNRRNVFFIRMADYGGVLKSFFYLKVKTFITEKDTCGEDGNNVGEEIIWRVCEKNRESGAEAC